MTAHTVTIKLNGGVEQFDPPSLDVKKGDTVSWKNMTERTHTATADDGTFDTGDIGRGATSTAQQINNTGSIPYTCSYHDWMKGKIVAS